MVPCFHRTPRPDPKRHLDRFILFRTVRGWLGPMSNRQTQEPRNIGNDTSHLCTQYMRRGLIIIVERTRAELDLT